MRRPPHPFFPQDARRARPSGFEGGTNVFRTLDGFRLTA
ncbi:hypothetical protein QFZ66_000523 [Streptomyces sp. B4I13]|nr:hypothetical protein [Streptomyces sp. B4I13]